MNSGTTQIPQFLLYDELPHLGSSQIACTEPRCSMTESIAQRVAEELDVELGDEVGYKALFEDFTGPKTILKYITDRALLHEAMKDSLLSNYSCIVVDKVDERTIATDILMRLLKTVRSARFLDLTLDLHATP
jgi:pre-mRNA-splicing factor ATP-dependent RNA helicase DHX15/PRP43